jgi:hypothetical protein
MVSSALSSVSMLTDSTPPPFFSAYSRARLEARAGSSGSACPPASADASTVLWSARSARYQGADVENRRAHPQENGQDDEREDDDLPGLAVDGRRRGGGPWRHRKASATYRQMPWTARSPA